MVTLVIAKFRATLKFLRRGLSPHGSVGRQTACFWGHTFGHWARLGVLEGQAGFARRLVLQVGHQFVGQLVLQFVVLHDLLSKIALAIQISCIQNLTPVSLLAVASVVGQAKSLLSRTSMIQSRIYFVDEAAKFKMVSSKFSGHESSIHSSLADSRRLSLSHGQLLG
jgi:hypothetical protein